MIGTIEPGKRYKSPKGEIKTVKYCSFEDVVFEDDSTIDKVYMKATWCPVEDMVEDNGNKCTTKEPSDRVNHPSYYQDPSGVECIDIVRHRDFNIGSAIKYLWRAGLKKEEGISAVDKQVEDLKKAIFYINDEIKLITKKQVKWKR